MDDQSRVRILSEHLLSELREIREYVKDVPAVKADVAELCSDIVEAKARLDVHEGILREHSVDIAEVKLNVKRVKGLLAGQIETITQLRAASHAHLPSWRPGRLFPGDARPRLVPGSVIDSV